MYKDASLLPTLKCNRSAAVPRIEKALFKWLCAKNNKFIALNGEMMVMQVQKLLYIAKEHLPDDQKLFVQFYDGWMERFEKSHILSFRRIHGYAKSADVDAISN